MAAETLLDALKKSGDADQVKLLTADAKKLTKKDAIGFFNSKGHEQLTIATVKSLRKLVKTRISKGQSVLPWKDLSAVELNESDDNMGGGFW